jgi:multimeric flavodoxin WrbA
MTITILNGDPSPNNGSFSHKINHLASELSESNQVHLFNLAGMNLHYCTGCWSCWWKTPGECAIKDDAEQIFRAVINSDFFIFASPLIAGFTSATLKKIQDRLIVLLHPYLELINEESHHRKRYEKYPEFGVILQREKDTDEEDLKIVKDIYDRLAINFHSKKRFTKFVDEIDSKEIERR